MAELKPDLGVIPWLPSPKPGDQIILTLEGEPPYKDTHFSIRNPKHPKFSNFNDLRKAASQAMKGRKWYEGPVLIDLTLNGPKLNRSLMDYVGGIMDSLDGSHGTTFTYLPIAYQDDCQVVTGKAKFRKREVFQYDLKVTFLGDLED